MMDIDDIGAGKAEMVDSERRPRASQTHQPSAERMERLCGYSRFYMDMQKTLPVVGIYCRVFISRYLYVM